MPAERVGLGDRAGRRGPAEMAMVGERQEVAELLWRRERNHRNLTVEISRTMR